jgi:hypothetical protein
MDKNGESVMRKCAFGLIASLVLFIAVTSPANAHQCTDLKLKALLDTGKAAAAAKYAEDKLWKTFRDRPWCYAYNKADANSRAGNHDVAVATLDDFLASRSLDRITADQTNADGVDVSDHYFVPLILEVYTAAGKQRQAAGNSRGALYAYLRAIEWDEGTRRLTTWSRSVPLYDVAERVGDIMMAAGDVDDALFYYTKYDAAKYSAGITDKLTQARQKSEAAFRARAQRAAARSETASLDHFVLKKFIAAHPMPTDTNLHMTDAITTLYKLGKIPEAIAAMTAYIDSNPPKADRLRAKMGRAALYAQMLDIDKAGGDLNEIFEQPNLFALFERIGNHDLDVNYIQRLGMVLMVEAGDRAAAQGNFKRANGYYDAVMTKMTDKTNAKVAMEEGDLPMIANRVGDIRLMADDRLKAITVYEMANLKDRVAMAKAFQKTALDSGSAATRTDGSVDKSARLLAFAERAVQLSSEGKHGEAIAQAKQALQYAETNEALYQVETIIGNAAFNGALAAPSPAHFAEAVEHFSKSIAIKPGNLQSYQRRGIARLRLNDVQGGYDDIAMLLKLDPANTQLPITLGAAAQRQAIKQGVALVKNDALENVIAVRKAELSTYAKKFKADYDRNPDRITKLDLYPKINMILAVDPLHKETLNLRAAWQVSEGQYALAAEDYETLAQMPGGDTFKPFAARYRAKANETLEPARAFTRAELEQYITDILPFLESVDSGRPKSGDFDLADKWIEKCDQMERDPDYLYQQCLNSRRESERLAYKARKGWLLSFDQFQKYHPKLLDADSTTFLVLRKDIDQWFRNMNSDTKYADD